MLCTCATSRSGNIANITVLVAYWRYSFSHKCSGNYLGQYVLVTMGNVPLPQQLNQQWMLYSKTGSENSDVRNGF